MPSSIDPTSLSNNEEFVAKHLKWKVTVDFSSKTLKCVASLKFECRTDNASQLVLDTRDLSIKKVHFTEQQLEAKFTVGEPVGPFGKPLVIDIPPNVNKKDRTFEVSIEYDTSPDASALQWLTPEQTAGKREPYLFTQCQAIHARSIVPCQDTPSVKMTYDAEITVAKALTALMSAVKGEEVDASDGRKTCHFAQKVPIPSYLIALVVGALERRKVGPRSHVWAEKEIVEACAYEFAETEKFLAAAESLMGDYVWGVYDLLILPPSFPYGGMENPCLTFCTPTLLAGDRSLTGVVAHEIAHSWTGNLVTNRNWEHFWLNEGFTRCVESKIIGLLEGEPMRQLTAIGGWKALIDAVEKFGKDHPLTALVPRLEGVDPDDAFSAIPYEKGCSFLYYIESLVGGADVFNVFLRQYIENFKYQTIKTEDFRNYLHQYFAGKPQEKALASIDWDAWLTQPGMPPVAVIDMYDTSLVDAAKALAQRWISASGADLNNFHKDDINGFSALQVVEFLSLLLLETSIEKSKVQKIGSVYDLPSYRNAEIRFRWLRLCVRADVSEQCNEVVKFLLEQGRMKYVRPLYWFCNFVLPIFKMASSRPMSKNELFKNPSMKELAIKTFQGNRKFYHRICENMVAKDLGLC